MDVNELGKFLLKLDKDITREEIEYIFNKFDDDGNNSIDFDEFKKWLEDNDVILQLYNLQVRMNMNKDQSRGHKKLSILP